jgi:hypothetical protein
LTTINLPSSLQHIYNGAFLGCTSLTSITIPDSINYIESEAFKNCTRLSEIVLPEKAITIYSDFINNTAYYNTATNWKDGLLYVGNHLISVDVNYSGVLTIDKDTIDIAREAGKGRKITQLIITASVEKINDYAFRDCSTLTSVVLPNTIKLITYNPFENCTELTAIYYNGTREDWSKTSAYNGFNTNILYYYSEEEPELNADKTAYNGRYWHYDEDEVTPVIWTVATEEVTDEQ